MADDPNKSQTSELDIIEGRAETLGDPVEVDLGESAGKGGKEAAAPEGAKRPEDDGRKDKPDDGMDALKAKVADAERRRLAAESRATQAEERARRHEADRATDHASIIDSSLREAERDRDQAKRAFADAQANAEWDKAADAQANIADAAVRISQFKQAKTELARRGGAERVEGAVTHRETEHDPVEAVARNCTPQTGAWLRAHPDCITDQALNAKMLRAHHAAIGDGLDPDTPEYFAAVEHRLFGQQQQRAETQPERQQEQQRREEPQRRQQVAAPARGGSSQSNGNGTRRTVTLTPEQRAMADSMDISYKAYAENMVALENEGRIGKRNVN